MGTIIQFPENPDKPKRPDASRFPRLFLKELNLSQDQILALISGNPENRSRIFEVAPRLEPADRDAVPVLSQTFALLAAVQSREPVRATAHGNLPVVIVKELFAGAFADAEPDFIRVNREDDSAWLSRVRRLAQKAGLLSFRKKTFALTKAGRSAFDSIDYNEMYRRLLEAHLRDPAAIDGFDRFGVHFGLFERGPTFEPPVEIPGRVHSHLARWRRTPLFDRAFRWHVEPPTLAVQRPEAAAATLMYEVHESRFRLDGTADYAVCSTCLRAIERCPSKPMPTSSLHGSTATAPNSHSPT